MIFRILDSHRDSIVCRVLTYSLPLVPTVDPVDLALEPDPTVCYHKLASSRAKMIRVIPGLAVYIIYPGGGADPQDHMGIVWGGVQISYGG